MIRPIESLADTHDARGMVAGHCPNLRRADQTTREAATVSGAVGAVVLPRGIQGDHPTGRLDDSLFEQIAVPPSTRALENLRCRRDLGYSLQEGFGYRGSAGVDQPQAPGTV